jgi:hypothetical protein
MTKNPEMRNTLRKKMMIMVISATKGSCQGVRKLMGEKLKVVWAELSTLISACCTSKPISKIENSAQVLSC